MCGHRVYIPTCIGPPANFSPAEAVDGLFPRDLTMTRQECRLDLADYHGQAPQVADLPETIEPGSVSTPSADPGGVDEAQSCLGWQRMGCLSSANGMERREGRSRILLEQNFVLSCTSCIPRADCQFAPIVADMRLQYMHSRKTKYGMRSLFQLPSLYAYISKVSTNN